MRDKPLKPLKPPPEPRATTAPTAARSSARDAILDAARQELAARGDFTVNAVAARAGVTRQTIQYHFGGAKGLRRALAEEGLLEPESGDSTYDRLVDAAIEVFAQPGGAVASIECIAAQAGLTKGAFYHHFADRKELLTAAAHRISPADEMLGVLEATEELPVRDALVAFAGTFYSAIRARAPMVSNLAAASAQDPELAEVVMGEILGRVVPTVVQKLGRRVASGEIRQVDLTLLVQALFGPVFMAIVVGPTVLQRMKRIGIRPAIENVEAYVDLVLEGARAQSDPDTAQSPRRQP